MIRSRPHSKLKSKLLKIRDINVGLLGLYELLLVFLYYINTMKCGNLRLGNK